MKFDLIEKLTPLNLNILDILLDPNNPRFAEIENNNAQVSEHRFAEEKVQNNTFNKMKNNFDVNILTNTIKELGFLPIDKIIVREWPFSGQENKKYVVIEGNRRVTALKSLLEQNENAAIDLTTEQIENYSKIEVLILDVENGTSLLNTLIPGLRHVSGIKDWGPYQKAKLIHQLREDEHFTAQEAAESLGLSVLKANNLYRSFKLFIQMSDNEEYGDEIETKMFSFAEEAMKKKILKDWFEWDDEEKEIGNTGNLTLFLSLFISKDDSVLPKLSRAIDVRDFGRIMESGNKNIISLFFSPGGSLPQALARIDSELADTHWKERITQSVQALENLSQKTLLNATDDDVKTIQLLQEQINTTLETIEKLKK